MLVFAIVVAILAGMVFGAVTLWLWLPKRYKHHIDYRQRWEDAVALLGMQGQLTDEQVSLIHAERPTPPETTTAETLRMLHSMASWDRKAIEVTRAENGLPPVDDLLGMSSFDKRTVMTARAQAGLARALKERKRS